MAATDTALNLNPDLDNEPSPDPATLFELALDEYLNPRRAGLAVMAAPVPGPWREDRV